MKRPEPENRTVEEAAKPEDGGAPAAAPEGTVEREPAPSPAAEAVGLAPVPPPPPTREELDTLVKERDELRDQLLRKRAEFDNYRKRVERDRHQAAEDATASLLRALIPTLDNLERALRAGGEESSLRQGVELIHRELLLFLEGQGLIALDPAGEPFDPQHHQAIAHEPAPGFEEGHVVEVLQKGYFFKDRLLRPAMVKVAKGTLNGDQTEGTPEAIH